MSLQRLSSSSHALLSLSTELLFLVVFEFKCDFPLRFFTNQDRILDEWPNDLHDTTQETDDETRGEGILLGQLGGLQIDGKE